MIPQKIFENHNFRAIPSELHHQALASNGGDSETGCEILDSWKGLGVNRKAKKKYKMELSVLGATWVRCLHPYIEPKSQFSPKSDKV